MRVEGQLPFRGEVIWLTPEQGGRRSGPPPTPADQDYAATAFAPPDTVATGLASFVLRVADRSSWRSEAEGDWLVVHGGDAPTVLVGCIIVVTEGARPVAHFLVREVVLAR